MPSLIPSLTSEDLQRIHTATLEVLQEEGVLFQNPEAVSLFKEQGFKTGGSRVFIDEKALDAALKTVPNQFDVKAMNPDRSITVDTRSTCFAPGCGAPCIADRNGVRRKATLSDYETFCRLIQTSDVIDLSGFLLVDICDKPADSAHLNMLLANISLCDKPFMGFPGTCKGTDDSIAMARIVWGDPLPPVMMVLVNGMAPLQFSHEMIHAMMAFAGVGQPLIITGGGIMGATAPVRLPGLLVTQNALVLSGIVLTQLVNPGTPVVYGATGATMNMATGAYLTARPEFNLAAGLGAQVAKFYDIPCRGGGAVTDSHLPDIQAGMESALTLAATVESGINVILLSFGMLGSLMAMGFEKFIIDEALCSTLRFMGKPVEISEESIDLTSILAVGAEGNYITHPQTHRHCRSGFFQSDLIRPMDYDAWRRMGSQRLDERAEALLKRRLEAYAPPDMDPTLKKALERYVKTHQ